MALSCRENPLFYKKNSLMTFFFTHFAFSHASDNTNSRNIEGTNAWAVPHLKCLGDRPPSPPKSPLMIISQFPVAYLPTLIMTSGVTRVKGQPGQLTNKQLSRRSWVGGGAAHRNPP